MRKPNTEPRCCRSNQSLAGNDGTEAGIQRVQADYWKSEVARAKELLESTQLRAPIDGIVATPHVENFVGRRLQYGDSFAEIVDASRAVVDVAIDDTDATLLRPNETAAIKLNGFPTRIFRGEVSIVSPKGETARRPPRFLCPGGDSECRQSDSHRHGRPREGARRVAASRLCSVAQSSVVDLFEVMVLVRLVGGFR